jgi:hypothetical protein
MIAFSSPFRILNGTPVSTTDYEKIVRDQLVDAVTTNQGERVMHPDWGCDIQAVLFDPASALERNDAAGYIRDRLIHMVRRALIKDVSVEVRDDAPNVVYIEIRYKTSNFSPETSVAVTLENESATTEATV